jgi:hypothetical protein
MPRIKTIRLTAGQLAEQRKAEREMIDAALTQLSGILWLWCWKTVNTTDPEQGEVTQ